MVGYRLIRLTIDQLLFLRKYIEDPELESTLPVYTSTSENKIKLPKTEIYITQEIYNKFFSALVKILVDKGFDKNKVPTEIGNRIEEIIDIFSDSEVFLDGG